MWPGRISKAFVLVVVAALLGACAPSVEQLQEDRDVAALSEVLGSDTEADVRADAAVALGAIGDADGVDALVAALGDPDASVRRAAAGALGVLRDPAAVEPLLTALGDADAEVRAAATDALASIMERLEADGNVPALVGILQADAPADLRADAAAALGSIGGSDGTAALVSALEDTEGAVRWAAARALGQLRDPEALTPLITALGDADTNVRAAAAASLDRIAGGADSSVVRSELLAIFRDGSTDERIAAAGLLGTSGVGDLEALGPLLTAVDDPDAGVQAAAANAAALIIEELGTSSDRVLIVTLSAGGPNARALAARSLATSVDSSAVEPLLMALGDEDAGVRDAAAGSLSSVLVHLPDGQAVQSLVAAIRALPDGASAAAEERLAEVLVAMGPQRAVAALSTVEVGDRWLAIALGVPESDLAAALQTAGIRLDAVADIEAVAAAVAGGEPSAATATYDGSDAFHPAMFFVHEGTALRRPGLNLEWEPMAIRHLELVVVEDDISWQQIQECLYNGPSIIRYRGTQTVRVLAARDGTLVASRTFQGTDPRACQPTEDYWLTELYGEEPDLAGMTEWLESIIHPPTP